MSVYACTSINDCSTRGENLMALRMSISFHHCSCLSHIFSGPRQLAYEFIKARMCKRLLLSGCVFAVVFNQSTGEKLTCSPFLPVLTGVQLLGKMGTSILYALAFIRSHTIYGRFLVPCPYINALSNKNRQACARYIQFTSVSAWVCVNVYVSSITGAHYRFVWGSTVIGVYSFRT